MNYLIDGHNLIPHIPGLSLQDMDDEQALIDLLVRFCVADQNQVEVFFDRAPVGFSGMRKYSRVTAHFVRTGKLADTAIRERLVQLGGSARNVKVVSSDRQVQAEARARGAKTVESAEFSIYLIPFIPMPPAAGSPGRKAKKTDPAAAISSDDMQQWMDMFGGEPDEGVPPPKNIKRKKRP